MNLSTLLSPLFESRYVSAESVKEGFGYNLVYLFTSSLGIVIILVASILIFLVIKNIDKNMLFSSVLKGMFSMILIQILTFSSILSNFKNVNLYTRASDPLAILIYMGAPLLGGLISAYSYKHAAKGGGKIGFLVGVLFVFLTLVFFASMMSVEVSLSGSAIMLGFLFGTIITAPILGLIGGAIGGAAGGKQNISKSEPINIDLEVSIEKETNKLP